MSTDHDATLRRVALFATLVVLVAHCTTVVALLDRRPHFDESQYLQAAWKMSHGERLYVDFIEDHAPFLFQIFAFRMPGGGTPDYPLLDALACLRRARLLTALLGTLALLAGGLIVRRAAASREALPIFLAALLGTGTFWRLGIADARNDPPALFLLLIGALLVMIPRRDAAGSLASGSGMGLVIVAFLWNPKWPLESLVLGVAYLVRVYNAGRLHWKSAVIGICAAVVPVAAALMIISGAASIRDYVFFTFELNAAMNAWARTVNVGAPALAHCPAAFHPAWVVPALVLVVCSALVQKRRLLLLVAAFVLAAGIEIRFIYVYPAAWPQYYLFWCLGSAAVYASLPRAILVLLQTPAVRLSSRATRLLQTGLPVAAVLAAMSYSLGGLWAQTIAPAAVNDAYWSSMSLMQKQLARGGTVWMDAPMHPIGVRDAHYYWFAFGDLLPFALTYAKTERGAKFLPPFSASDLPICRLERGERSDLRFVSDLRLPLTPDVTRCFERSLQSGLLVPARVARTYEVTRR